MFEHLPCWPFCALQWVPANFKLCPDYWVSKQQMPGGQKLVQSTPTLLGHSILTPPTALPFHCSNILLFWPPSPPPSLPLPISKERCCQFYPTCQGHPATAKAGCQYCPNVPIWSKCANIVSISCDTSMLSESVMPMLWQPHTQIWFLSNLASHTTVTPNILCFVTKCSNVPTLSLAFAKNIGVDTVGCYSH